MPLWHIDGISHGFELTDHGQASVDAHSSNPPSLGPSLTSDPSKATKMDWIKASSLKRPLSRQDMSLIKPIVVIGATGTQGSSAISTFLTESGWRVRGIARNPQSDASRALFSEGVEMVAADINDTQALVGTFEGANAIFAVTDFFSSPTNPTSQTKPNPGQTINEYSFEYEKRQGITIMDAVSIVKPLERFVSSRLSAVKKWSRGKYSKVYHFDSKAEATEFVKTTYPETWAKTSVIMVGFYLENTRRDPLLIPRKGRLRGCSSNIAFAEPPILPQSQMAFMRYPQITVHPSYGRLSRPSMILAFSCEPSSSMLQLGRMYTRSAASYESRGFYQALGKTNGGPVRYREISCVRNRQISQDSG